MKEVFLDEKDIGRIPSTANVFQRIYEVMKRIRYIEKTPAEEGKPPVLLSDAVVSALSAALIDNRLVILPVKEEHTRSETRIAGVVNHLTEVDMTYRIQNIDDPNDYILVASMGSGVDLQDKGGNKALTAAYKYMVRQSFAISSPVDDPDNITSEDYTRRITEGAASGEYGKAKNDRMKMTPTVDTPIEEAIEL